MQSHLWHSNKHIANILLVCLLLICVKESSSLRYRFGESSEDGYSFDSDSTLSRHRESSEDKRSQAAPVWFHRYNRVNVPSSTQSRVMAFYDARVTPSRTKYAPLVAPLWFQRKGRGSPMSAAMWFNGKKKRLENEATPSKDHLDLLPKDKIPNKNSIFSDAFLDSKAKLSSKKYNGHNSQPASDRRARVLIAARGEYQPQIYAKH